RRRHTRSYGDWSSDVCSSDLRERPCAGARRESGEDHRRIPWDRKTPDRYPGVRGKSAKAGPKNVKKSRGHFPRRPARAGATWARSEERRVGKGGVAVMGASMV